LVGKRVVITGAASGIGRSLALKLVAGGADVWALDLDETSLASLTDDATKYGHPITTRRADVTDRAALAKIRDEVVAKGEIDYWVNNAGIARLGDFHEHGEAGFDQVVAVNLTGVVNGTRLALEAMEDAGRGRIVNMASIAGHLPAPFMTAYVASKHAVVGFTRSLAEELRLKDSPVSLLLVSPGFVDTRIIAKGEKMGFPEWLSFLLAKPDEVADTILAALPTKKREIIPTFNGKLMRRMYAVLPGTTVRSSKILLTKSWKDIVTNRYTR
jgi:short-subunit dehydrogenase